jgi:hypothetical protein
MVGSDVALPTRRHVTAAELLGLSEGELDDDAGTPQNSDSSAGQGPIDAAVDADFENLPKKVAHSFSPRHSPQLDNQQKKQIVANLEIDARHQSRIAALADVFLRACALGAPCGELAMALANAVVDASGARVAVEILEGGEFAVARAIELAKQILEPSDNAQTAISVHDARLAALESKQGLR